MSHSNPLAIRKGLVLDWFVTCTHCQAGCWYITRLCSIYDRRILMGPPLPRDWRSIREKIDATNTSLSKYGAVAKPCLVALATRRLTNPFE